MGNPRANEVGVGGYTLEIGDPGGTLIREAGPQGCGAVELGAALREATPWEASLAEPGGAWLEIRELESWITPGLDRIARLDRDGRVDEAIQLARDAQRVLVLARRWLALVRMLLGLLRRARLRGDNATIAWAQHELGTLHLAAGNAAEADERLTEAHALRRELGQPAALAATERNLRVLCRHLRKQLHERQRDQHRLRRLSLATFALLLLGLGGVAGATLPAANPTPTPEPAVTPATYPQPR